MSELSSAGIIGKHNDDPRVGATIGRLAAHLARRGIAVRYEAATARMIGVGDGLRLDELAQHSAVIVVVGGDGTLLHAAREVAPFGVPLVGINIGRLGFLVDVSPDQLEEHLDPILAGEYESDVRSLLEVRIGTAVGRAVNDIVVHKWNTMRMIELETYIDGCFVNVQRSDGVIVATPTGSTAYALSGGGPLLYPGLDALVLVPICPHTLSNRPLVVAGDSAIEFCIRNYDPAQVRLTCDGQVDLPLCDGEPIRIARSPLTVRLLHPRGHDHYAILRAKLGWGGSDHAERLC